MFIAALALWFVSIAACVGIARQKGRSRLRWFFPGLLFGFLALVVLAAIPSSGSGDGAEGNWFGSRQGRRTLALGAVILSFIQLSILLIGIPVSESPRVDSTEREGQTSASISQVKVEVQETPDLQTIASGVSARGTQPQIPVVTAEQVSTHITTTTSSVTVTSTPTVSPAPTLASAATPTPASTAVPTPTATATPTPTAAATPTPTAAATPTPTAAATPTPTATATPTPTATATPTPSRAPALGTSARFASKGGARSEVFQLVAGRYELALAVDGNGRDPWRLELFRRQGDVLLLEGAGEGASVRGHSELLVEDSSWDLWFRLDVGDDSSWSVALKRVGELPPPESRSQPIPASTAVSQPPPSQSADFSSRGSARSQVFQLDKGRYEVVVAIAGNDRRFVPDSWKLEIFRLPGDVLLLSGAGHGISDGWYGEALVEDAFWNLSFTLDVGDDAGWTVKIKRIGDLPPPTPQPVRTSRPATTPIASPTSSSTPAPILASTPTAIPIRLTLTELFDEYEENKVRANSRLRYQENGNIPVSTSGYVYQVEDLYAVIAPTRDEYPSRDMRCYYADTRNALHLSKWQSVSITGRVRGIDGFSSSVGIYSCEFDGIVLDSNPTVSAQDLRGNIVQVFCTIDVIIFTFAQKGTGIIIDTEKGIVLTVHHVVADENECQKIEVEVPGIEGRVPATTVRHCASIDRARLQIPSTHLAGLSLRPIFRASAPAQVDQQIYFWGYGPGELRMQTGIVNDVFGSQIVTDAYAVPGDSGAPVFNEDGHLLGTVSSGNRSDRSVFTGEEC